MGSTTEAEARGARPRTVSAGASERPRDRSAGKQAAEYRELHAHTAFSFLEGANEPETVVERAAEIGLSAVAVTDRGGVYGLPRFAKMAREAGIEAICGAEVPLEDGSRLPLLVESARGWSNLCRLLTTTTLSAATKGEGRAG